MPWLDLLLTCLNCSLLDVSHLDLQASTSTSTSTSTKRSSAEETHAIISKDNGTIRSDEKESQSQSQSSIVLEKFFDIEVDEAICDMRNDTKLVLIDIPGINEADSSKKYKEYVEQKWDSFDCVCVVMDAMAGVNTLEQVELLKFVHQNNQTLKRIPTIVLGNKVDDPTDEDTLTLVEETREKTIEIFGQGCTEKSLQSLLDAANNGNFYAGEQTKKNNQKQKGRNKNKSNKNKNSDDDEAVFIPISAKNAFIYRKAVHLSVDTFEKGSCDQDLFDKIGKDEVGRRWNKMSAEEKVRVISSIMNDPNEYKERLAGTNFDNFLAVIKYFIGGNDTQRTLLANQIEIVLKSLSADNINNNNNNNKIGESDRDAPVCGGSISKSIHNVYRKCTAAGRSTNDLPDKFWDLYDQCEETSFLTLEQVVVDPSVLQRPFIELEMFYELCGILDWDHEQTTTRQRMEQFLSKQFDLIICKEKSWKFDTFYDLAHRGTGARTEEPEKKKRRKGSYGNSCWKAAPKVISWESLSPIDFETIFSSILLPSCEYEIYSKFGKQKVLLEKLVFQYRLDYDYESNQLEQTSSLKRDYIGAARSLSSTDTEEIKVKGDPKDAIIKVTMPEDLSNPSHWGYIAGKYIAFCRSHTSRE